MLLLFVFFFKQKTAYEMRISDWSSDVCSSDLPWDVGWRIGDAHEPRGGELWVPWDRTAGVIGPQGSGKTLDLLTPALLSAPGAALVTLTKVEDLLLSLTEPSRDDRPCVVLDPFRFADGVVNELTCEPIAGYRDPQDADQIATPFTATTAKCPTTGPTEASAPTITP